MFILLLAALLLLLLGWNIYYRRHWYRQVDVTLDFDRTSVYAGEQVELTEVITNRKKLPLPVLEVGFHTRKEFGIQRIPMSAIMSIKEIFLQYLADSESQERFSFCAKKEDIIK